MPKLTPAEPATHTSEKKLIAFSLPGVIGFLIVAYDYCCPGLSRIPNLWNEIIWRFLFIPCFFGGAVTSLLGLMFLQTKWESLGPNFKSIVMVLNLGWLGTVAYIAFKLHASSMAH